MRVHVVFVAVYALFVVALGALVAAGVYAAVQYLLFIEQVLRISVCSEVIWVGPYIPGRISDSVSALLDPGGMGRIAVLGIHIQIGCMAAAAYSLFRVRALRLSTLRGERAQIRIDRLLSSCSLLVSVGLLIVVTALVTLRIESSIGAIWSAIQSDTAIERRIMLVAISVSKVLNYALFAILSVVPQFVFVLVLGCIVVYDLSYRAGLERVLETSRCDEGAATTWKRISCAPRWAAPLVGATIVVSIIPTCTAAPWFFYRLIRTFESLSRIPPFERVPKLVATLENTRSVLESSLAASIIGIGIVTALAVFTLVILPVLHRRDLSDFRNVAPLSWRAPLAGVFVLLLLTLSFIWVAGPYQAENRNPIEVVVHPGGILAIASPAPSIEGPDVLEKAPILKITPGLTTLDDRKIDKRTATDNFSTLRRHWVLSHPGKTFSGHLIVLCGIGANGAEVVPLLRAAHRIGYTQLQFGFGRWQTFHRPILGEIRKPSFSAARAILIDARGSDKSKLNASARPSTNLSLTEAMTCDELTRTLVTMRTADRSVNLLLPEQNSGGS